MLSKEPIKIYYFTGTGNTLLAAQAIQKHFQQSGYVCELANMEIVDPKTVTQSCHIGLAFPVAIQSTYPLVWDFVQALPQGQGRKVFMFDTMEAFSGGIVGPLKRTLTKKGYICMGAREFKMPSSMQKVEVDLTCSKALLKDTYAFVQALIKESTTWRRVPICSDIMRMISKGPKIWRQMSETLSVDHGICVQCGLCESLCPTQAIQMPVFPEINHDLCQCCMRCLNYCPSNSFRLKGKALIQNQPLPVGVFKVTI